MANPTLQSSAFRIDTSPYFGEWLITRSTSLAFTTYQAGKLFLIGAQPDGRLSVFERTFDHCMGLYATEQRLVMSSRYQLWHFENALAPQQLHQGYDRLYIPQLAYTTGNLDIHDLAIDSDGQIVFVNTLFNCLATVDEHHSFKPIWQPWFISQLVAEDRCHLNGLALDNGQPRYMTCVGQSDQANGWRVARTNGGLLIDIQRNEIIADGLSMPHSPRIYRDKLWLLNAGTGELGYLDSGRFQTLAFCHGFPRGLGFIGDYAVVGLSKPRHDAMFDGLVLGQALEQQGHKPRCGAQVFDINTGECVHWLYLEGVVEELYDVAILPNTQRPMALGFKTDEIEKIITIAPH
ncbi:MAG: TIGR03032 family protein [Pseudomonadota bacterium]